jgi:hypothetical protein
MTTTQRIEMTLHVPGTRSALPRGMRSFPFLALALVAACSNAADPADSPDAPPSGDAAIDAPAGPPLDILRVNEVVAAGAPDWFEVVNMTAASVELSEYCYIDSGALAGCKAFPAMSLAPMAHFAQDVDDTISGFKLAGDEEVNIYRISDMRLSDKADWAEGDSPASESWARIPDITGAFARTNMVTKNAANVADNPTAPLKTLVVNEVAADEPSQGDWVEIANATNAAIELSEYCIIDTGATPCSPLPAMQLAAGAYYVRAVNDTDTGFGINGSEAVTIKRISDMRVSDTADWDVGGAGPAGTGSFQRSPTITGAFVPSKSPQTKNAAN